MKYLSFLAPFIMLFLFGCHAVCRDHSSNPLSNYDYDYFYTDIPNEQKLKLTFISKSKRQLCVGRETWPTEQGIMESSANSNGVYLFVQQKIFSFKETERLGYCAEKSCYTPVNNGEKVEAYLYYKDFGLTGDSYSSVKILKYKPEPFWCDLGNFIN